MGLLGWRVAAKRCEFCRNLFKDTDVRKFVSVNNRHGSAQVCNSCASAMGVKPRVNKIAEAERLGSRSPRKPTKAEEQKRRNKSHGTGADEWAGYG